ncbi:MAG TPA: FHA domain-containing protein [Victivallales bacterium]|nr:FHA domain-containing protein [Victivallales bacterium]
MPYVSYIEKSIPRYFKLPEEKMAIFGREDHVDFQVIKDSLISREHFGIEKDDNDDFVIIDLGSSNGTSLNGEKLPPNEVVPLKDGDIIKFGRMELTYAIKAKKNTTSEILNQVTTEYRKGKGYNTIMREIIGKNKKK